MENMRMLSVFRRAKVDNTEMFEPQIRLPRYSFIFIRGNATLVVVLSGLLSSYVPSLPKC